ncbi:MAG: OmpA family protein [Gammaproteobacteria bacterium]|nr:OmpA family protein [Gammaproteobacteria bacterium]
MKKIIVSSLSTIAFTAILSQPALAAYGVSDFYSAAPYREVYGNDHELCQRIIKEKLTDPELLNKCGYKILSPSVKQELVLTPTAASVTTTVANEISIQAALLFDFDSDVLSSNARAVIDERTAKYRNKGQLTANVEVVGHADSTGSESYNQKLSERRAQAVANYLEQNTNITHDKLHVYGQGETNPIASNTTTEGRSENRRVIITLNAEAK